ncbi:hypothetical protein M1N79_04295, partial [Dehalococcoidia bacterium]|nr:hypothetical protein [Dehalococcoidia bacterium]
AISLVNTLSEHPYNFRLCDDRGINSSGCDIRERFRQLGRPSSDDTRIIRIRLHVRSLGFAGEGHGKLVGTDKFLDNCTGDPPEWSDARSINPDSSLLARLPG